MRCGSDNDQVSLLPAVRGDTSKPSKCPNLSYQDMWRVTGTRLRALNVFSSFIPEFYRQGSQVRLCTSSPHVGQPTWWLVGRTQPFPSSRQLFRGQSSHLRHKVLGLELCLFTPGQPCSLNPNPLNLLTSRMSNEYLNIFSPLKFLTILLIFLWLSYFSMNF